MHSYTTHDNAKPWMIKVVTTRIDKRNSAYLGPASETSLNADAASKPVHSLVHNE